MSRICAVRSGPGVRELLDRFCRYLAAEGVDVHGLLQRLQPRPDGSAGYVVEDLHGGRRYEISQNLGPGSASCSVDPRGLAEASVVLRRAVAENADLVVVSRFGKLEAARLGLAAEMLEIMAAGIPLLTAVDEQHAAQWREITGGTGIEVEADEYTLLAWWRGLSR